MGVDGYRLGVDFGTSMTVAVLEWPDGRSRPLLFDASPLLPSAVFVGAAGEVLTGADAERAVAVNPAGFEANPKRRIDDGTVWLGERPVAVIDLVAAVLGRVAAEAGRVAGGAPGEVVLTHPVAWSRTRLGLLADAAARAGLGGTVRFVPEPVAAAVYFSTVLDRRLAPGGPLVVYDLGAGTFDVSVVRAAGSSFEVVAAGGLDDVGGLDLDAAVVAHLRALTAGGIVGGIVGGAAAWRRLDRPETTADEHTRHLLWRSARAAKEQLSRHSTADVRIPVLDTTVHLTREEFEAAARPYLERTASLTLEVLRGAGVARERIGGVFLVGGSSRIPLAATLLHRTLGVAPIAIEQPELVVAEGSLHGPERTSWTTPAPDPPVAPGPPPAAPTPAAPTAAAATPAAPTAVAPTAVAPTPVVLPRPRLSRRAAIVGAAGGLAGLAATALAIGRPWSSVFGHEQGGQGVWSSGSPQSPASQPPREARRTGRLTGQSGTVLDLAYHPKDNGLLATASSDGTIQLWNPTALTAVGAPLTGHQSYVRGVAFSPDGTTLASCGNDDTVRFWSVADRRAAGPPVAGHSELGEELAFSPDGGVIALAGADGAIHLFDAVRRQPLEPPLTGHTDAVNCVAFHPRDGNVLASGGDDHTVRVWDLAGRRQSGPSMLGHTDNIRRVVFSPSGQLLASCAVDATVRLWTYPKNQMSGQPLSMSENTGGVAFSPDGAVLATGERDVRLWDVVTRGALSSAFDGPAGGVYALRFSPDGTTLVSAGDSIDVWRISVA